jgi:hypothetical protein
MYVEKKTERLAWAIERNPDSQDLLGEYRVLLHDDRWYWRFVSVNSILRQQADRHFKPASPLLAPDVEAALEDSNSHVRNQAIGVIKLCGWSTPSINAKLKQMILQHPTTDDCLHASDLLGYTMDPSDTEGLEILSHLAADPRWPEGTVQHDIDKIRRRGGAGK